MLKNTKFCRNFAVLEQILRKMSLCGAKRRIFWKMDLFKAISCLFLGYFWLWLWPPGGGQKGQKIGQGGGRLPPPLAHARSAPGDPFENGAKRRRFWILTKFFINFSLEKGPPFRFFFWQGGGALRAQNRPGGGGLGPPCITHATPLLIAHPNSYVQQATRFIRNRMRNNAGLFDLLAFLPLKVTHALCIDIFHFLIFQN